MSAYEGSKMQERDEDAKKMITFAKKFGVEVSATDEHKKQLLAATVHKGDIPFEQEAEKKMQVYEAARRLEFPAFMEWMFDKKYFIFKG